MRIHKYPQPEIYDSKYVLPKNNDSSSFGSELMEMHNKCNKSIKATSTCEDQRMKVKKYSGAAKRTGNLRPGL